MSEQEQTSLYGARGKKIDIGGTELQVDDEFLVATLLAVIAVLNTLHPSIDEHISAVGQKIYDEITKTN
jgi:hypothetical protein